MNGSSFPKSSFISKTPPHLHIRFSWILRSISSCFSRSKFPRLRMTWSSYPSKFLSHHMEPAFRARNNPGFARDRGFRVWVTHQKTCPTQQARNKSTIHMFVFSVLSLFFFSYNEMLLSWKGKKKINLEMSFMADWVKPIHLNKSTQHLIISLFSRTRLWTMGFGVIYTCGFYSFFQFGCSVHGHIYLWKGREPWDLGLPCRGWEHHEFCLIFFTFLISSFNLDLDALFFFCFRA